MKLTPQEELLQSYVVANCRMNRKRGLSGINSYEKEVGFNIEIYLLEKAQLTPGKVSWLDICCGEGNALVEFCDHVGQKHFSDQILVTGIDLAGMFNLEHPARYQNLQLIETDFESWQTESRFDLITCIHGLHYIGDKLRMLQKANTMLKPEGLFIGNLSLENVRDHSNHSLGPALKSLWKDIGWEYSERKKLLKFSGNTKFPMKYEYIGADETAGPNYTGQEAVNSYYKMLT